MLRLNEPMPGADDYDQDDQVDYASLWRQVARNARFIVIFTGVIVFLACCFLLYSRPEFTATGSLYTGGLKPSAVSADDMSDSSAPSYLNYLATFQAISDVESQIDFLKSPTQVEKAVLASGLNASVTGDASSSPRFWDWKLRHHGSVAAYRPRASDLQAVDASFADPSVAKQVYTIAFSNAGKYQILQGGSDVLDGTLDQPASGGGLNILLEAANPGFVPAAGASYALKVTAAPITAQMLLAGPLSVTPGGTATLPSETIGIALSWSNPYQAQDFVRQLMNDYIDTMVSWNSSEAGDMENFISDQLTSVRSAMSAADQRLADYQQQTGILSPPDNAKDVIDEESQYEVQRTQLQVQAMALQQMWKELNTPADGIDPYLISEASNTSLSQLSESLAQADASLHSMRIQFTGNAPEVEAQQAEVTQLKTAIRSMVSNAMTQAQSQLASINILIAQYQNQMKAMPAQTLQVTGLTRASDVLGQLYVLLMQKQQEAALSKAAAVSSTRVLTQPELPLKSSRPLVLITLVFAFVIGIMMSAGIAVVREVARGRLMTEGDVRRLIRAPVYGVIPARKAADGTGGLVGAPHGDVAEAFRLLRGRLNFPVRNAALKVILLNAAGDGEDANGTALNLAKAIADGGETVLVVDADLRTGGLHRALGVAEAPGLAEYLRGEAALLEQKVPGQRFSMVAAGKLPDAPAELLNNAGLQAFFETLRARYDRVVICSASLSGFSDSMAMASYADIVFSIVELGTSTRRRAAAHHALVESLAQRQGLIINGAGRVATHGDGRLAARATSSRKLFTWGRRWKPAR